MSVQPIIHNMIHKRARYRGLMGEVGYDLLTAGQGRAAPTFTRDTTATFTDYEGILRTAQSGEARWDGGRYVRNLLLNSGAPATQSVSLASGKTYLLWTTGSGSVVVSGGSGATGTATEATPLILTITGAVSATFTVSGTVNGFQLQDITGGLGNTFSEVAPQLSSQTAIYSMAVLNGELYGGTYPNGKLFKWNGSNAWIEVAPQLSSQTTIRSMAVLNGEIYGGTAPNGKLFKWNGSNAWIEVAPQLSSQTYILSMAVLNGELYGGTNPNGKLFKWNGGIAPSEYVPTTSAAASRWFFTHPSTGAPLSAKLLMEGAGTNKITAKTANPTDITGWTKGGDAASVLSVVDDSAALAAAGLSALCSSGKVLKLDNSAGAAAAYVVGDGYTGNTNVHAQSIFIRGDNGTLTLSHTAASPTFFSASSSYVRRTWTGTPSVSTRMYLEVAAGKTIYFILPQLEESSVVSSAIPNDTGSALARNADALSWPLTADLKAMFSIDSKWKTAYDSNTLHPLTWNAETNLCSFADGQSWFGNTGRDFSEFANSGKMIILRDSVGRLAWGYAGASGPGETFGSELALNPTFETGTTGWTAYGGTITLDADAYSGSYAGLYVGTIKLVSNFGAGSAYFSSALGKLYKTYSALKPKAGSVRLRVFQVGSPYSELGSGSLVTDTSIYTVSTFKFRNISALTECGVYGTNSLIDSFSLKEVTAPSNQCLYVYKDRARTTQGWNMEASFDMNNTAYTYTICEDCSVEGTVVLDWMPGFSMSNQVAYAYYGILDVDGAGDSGTSLMQGYSTARSLCARTSKDGTQITNQLVDHVSGDILKAVLRFSTVSGLCSVSWLKAGVLSNTTPVVFSGYFNPVSLLQLHRSNAYPAKYGKLQLFNRVLADQELSRLT